MTMATMSRLDDILAAANKRASDQNLPYAGALTPKEAAELLQLNDAARLVDVRTAAELDWVGRVPGAIGVEWQRYPGSIPNTGFVEDLQRSIGGASPVLFMCRSGARSSAAAKAATEAGISPCFNVLEGFEGDKNAEGHRGGINGWRFHGLPWVQS
jgi:rhodanese-related sulfurtransferase